MPKKIFSYTSLIFSIYEIGPPPLPESVFFWRSLIFAVLFLNITVIICILVSVLWERGLSCKRGRLIRSSPKKSGKKKHWILAAIVVQEESGLKNLETILKVVVKRLVFEAYTRNLEAQNGILAANMVFASRRDLARVQNQVAYGFERKSGRFSRNRGNLGKKTEISKKWE